MRNSSSMLCGKVSGRSRRGCRPPSNGPASSARCRGARKHHRAMRHGGAAVAQALEVVGVREVQPGMVVEKDAVADDEIRPERADLVEPAIGVSPVRRRISWNSTMLCAAWIWIGCHGRARRRVPRGSGPPSPCRSGRAEQAGERPLGWRPASSIRSIASRKRRSPRAGSRSYSTEWPFVVFHGPERNIAQSTARMPVSA